jgi:hypothetical protein
MWLKWYEDRRDGMMVEPTKRLMGSHQRLKLGATIIASIVVAAVLGAVMMLASIQVGFFTPPLGEYRFGPLEVISLYDRQVCLPNQVCADDAYILYLGIRTADETALGVTVIHRPGQ